MLHYIIPYHWMPKGSGAAGADVASSAPVYVKASSNFEL